MIVIDLGEVKRDIEAIKNTMGILKRLDIGFFELQVIVINKYGLTPGAADDHIEGMERISGITLRRD